jgi:hypothetical protein
MGYSGWLVVHRGDHGWSLSRVGYDQPPDHLTRLRDDSGAPVLAAEILDSSAAYVEGLGLSSPDWHVWLQLDSAMAYLITPPAPFDDDDNYLGDDWSDPQYEREVADRKAQLLAAQPPDPAASARAWALDAGLTPHHPDEVRRVLIADRDTFVEDQFRDLLTAVGLKIG